MEGPVSIGVALAGGEALGSVIALIGLPGAGKSAVAPLLAARLRWGWADLDEEIARAAGAPVPELLRGRGEPAFRALEARALEAALDAERGPAGPAAVPGPAPGRVLACGGGILSPVGNRALLRERAFVVWLRVSPRSAAARLGAALAAERPLLDGAGSLEARIAALEAGRRGLYEAAADVVVSTDGRAPAEIAEEILAAWGARWGSSGS